MEITPEESDLELKGIPEHIRSKLIDMKIKLDGIESIVNKLDSKREEEIQSGKIVSGTTGSNQSTLYSSTVKKNLNENTRLFTF